MSFFRMPPQIVRLVLLTIAIIGSYLVARYFLTPPSFGEFGWYRGDALEELASRERVFAGRKECEQCHSDEFKKLSKGPHKGLSCEACHGVSLAHAENPDVKVDKEAKFGPCMRCHDANPARPKFIKQITIKTHYTAGKCAECHVPHNPLEAP